MLTVTAGLAVLVGSFWISLQVLDYWATPPDPDADLIKVMEATYGANCRGLTSDVRAGNATTAIAQGCAQARKTCSFVIDVNRLGDPARGCGKDFSVGWRCGADETINRVYLAGEANGQRVVLACPWG
jgi:hypothetical protein